MSLVDRKVPHLSEKSIAIVADACREIGTLPCSPRVNLETILSELGAHGVESIFRLKTAKTKGRLKIKLISDSTLEPPAYVKFKPSLTMYVQKGVWSRFKEGHSGEQVIIAHEIGHIMLHDDTAKAFSRAEELEIKFTGSREDSAEWQANMFADHLLTPTNLVLKFADSNRISILCNVPEDFADERLAYVYKVEKKLIPLCAGEPCSKCGNFTVESNESGKKCNTPSCGHQQPSTTLDAPAGS